MKFWRKIFFEQSPKSPYNKPTTCIANRQISCPRLESVAGPPFPRSNVYFCQ